MITKVELIDDVIIIPEGYLSTEESWLALYNKLHVIRSTSMHFFRRGGGVMPLHYWRGLKGLLRSQNVI